MKRTILTLVVLALLLSPAYAQSARNAAVLTATTCPGVGCVTLPVTGVGGVAVQITGTFSATAVFEGSIDGVTYVAVNMTPPNSTTPATSATAAGIWTGAVGGLTVFRVRLSGWVSGAVNVTIQNAPSRG